MDTYFAVVGDAMDTKLAPVDEVSAEALRQYGEGEVVRVKLFKDRNIRFHRKYWALLQMVYQNQDTYKSLEAFHFALKVAAGWIDHVEVGDKVYLMPKSIAFAKMTEQEFSVYYLDAVRAIKDLIPQWNVDIDFMLSAFE